MSSIDKRPSALVHFVRRPEASARLVCLPHAGGGAAAFRQWAPALPASVEVVVAQLPGRESRLSERPLTSIHEMVEQVALAIEALPAVPTVIFGHSLGSLVSYELIHALLDRGLSAPMHFFVAASRPPAHHDDGMPQLHRLPSDEMVAEIDRRYGGVPAAVRAQRELMELLVPTLRADITALETYAPAGHPPLACPITAFAGTLDARATAEAMAGWRSETTGAFTIRSFAGGHFFLNDHRAALIAEVAAAFDAATTEEVR